MNKRLQIPETLQRKYSLEKSVIDEKNRTVNLAFSSEAAVERIFGNEILDHKPGSIRLDRIKKGGPLLMDHNPEDQIGVIESVTIGADRIARAVVRFSKSARAEEIFQDVKDGIRQSISVGYRIYEMVVDSTEGNIETYRAIDWEPYEVSVVSIPADINAQIGRNQEIKSKTKEIQVMKTASEETPVIDRDQVRAEVLNDERKRTKALNNLGQRYQNFNGEAIAKDAIANGLTVEEMEKRILQELPQEKIRSKTSAPGSFGYSDIGLSNKEASDFSFLRLLNAGANPQDRKAREAASFELEACSAAQKSSGKSSRGFVIPMEALAFKHNYQRDLNVATPSAGGNLVADNLLHMSFIDLLRNEMVLSTLGAQFLENLVGNVSIPRQSGSSSVYWVAEGDPVTESELTLSQVPLSPKTVGTFTDISRKFLAQSSINAEMLIRLDIARSIALGIEHAAINGTGAANQPLGILNTAGIGSVIGGTDGADLTFDHMIDLETAVTSKNAGVSNLGYLTNAKVRGKLKRTFTNGTYGERQVWEPGNIVNDYFSTVTNAVPSDLTKGAATGICSAAIFGNWNDLLIGLWGGLDLTVDPYTGGTAGTVRVIGLQDVDVAVRHPESFAAIVDGLTT